MHRQYPFAPILGVVICLAYLLCTGLAWSKYPGPYSPVDNWLSDLGNRATSPEGSKYYNTGIMVSGSLLVLFFLSLSAIRLPRHGRQRIFLAISQASGVVGAIGMILTGILSIDKPSSHSVMSAVLRIGVGTAFGFTLPALAYHRGVRRWILSLGAVTTLLDLVVSMLFNRTKVLEWPVITLLLAYCISLGAEAWRLQKIVAAKSESAS